MKRRDKLGLRKGAWHHEEDERLKAFVAILGEKRWDSIAKATGLRRSGKSCRLRWLNYLKPSLKRGPITPDEECLIFKLHAKWGNKWARIAKKLQGRTDNAIKNFWRSHLRKQKQMQKTTLVNSTINMDDNTCSQETSTSSDQSNMNQVDLSQEDDNNITTNLSSNHNEEDPFNPKGCIDNKITSMPFGNEVSYWTNIITSEPSYNESSTNSWDNKAFELCYDYHNSTLWDCSGFDYDPESFWT